MNPPNFRIAKLSDLHEDPANARKHPERNRSTVRASLQEFGQVEALVIESGTGRVLGGNCRLTELRALGVEEVQVCEVDTHGIDATRLALVLNRSAEIAEWDTETLAAIIRDLGEEAEGIGWDEAEIEALTAEPIEPTPADDDAPPVQPGEPDSKPGEVYELGPHRLVCGDCSDSTVVDLLGRNFGAVVTDPPYGIDASKMTMGSGESSKPRGKRLSTVNEWDGTAPDVLWLLAEAALVCVWGGNYVGTNLPTSDDWLVWDKKNPNLSFAEAELAWTNFGKRIRVLAHHWSGEEKLHITMKPVPVIVWCLGFLPERCTVFDPFSGSGTTLISCALTGRVARCIEIDPHYCDVIRRRWTKWAKEHNQNPGPGALE